MDGAQCIATLTVERAESSPWLFDKQIQIFVGKDIIIGRVGSKSALRLQSDFVSKRHFRIYSVIYDDEKLSEFPPFIYCQDLGSTNGTYVNELFIGSEQSIRSPIILNDGDIISILPHWSFRFHQALGNQKEFDDLQRKEIELFEDRFAISNRLLGEGGCAAVYLGKDAASQRQLACKVVDLRRFSLKFNKNNTEEAMEGRTKLIREIEFLSRLNHPNIATLYKAFRSEHSLYIFSELARGGDLFSFVQAQGGSIGDLETCVIIRQVAVAVDYLHSNDIAHRDLKPDNILVMHAGIGHRVVLTDFGYATHINSSRRMMSPVGTREYVAPEVYKTDDKGYTKAIDMWSMGIVTLSLFTGDTHIKFKELRDLGQSTITSRITNALQNPWVQISARARDFIERLLVFDPKERMLANEAVKHDWFQRPDSPGVAAKLDELYERANKHWWKRTSSTNLIEYLPDVTIAEGKRGNAHKRSRRDRKIRKKIPDATASPYFGLDRHLQHPEAVSASVLNSKRRMLLAELIETDSEFIDPGKQAPERGTIIEMARTIAPFPIKPPPRNIVLRQKLSTPKTPAENPASTSRASTFSSQNLLTTELIKEVDAIDLFRTAPVETRVAQANKDPLSNLSPLQPSLAPGSSYDVVMGGQGMNSQSTGIGEHEYLTLQKLSSLAYQHVPPPVSDIGNIGPCYASLQGRENCEDSPSRPDVKGTKRSYTESIEDRNIHEEAAKALPKLTTAKAYSRAIAKEKQVAQSKSPN